jgi:hypothetical protein
VRQTGEWRDDDAVRRQILIAAARYVAAHSPTERSSLQTATVARRLGRGQPVHEAEG